MVTVAVLPLPPMSHDRLHERVRCTPNGGCADGRKALFDVAHGVAIVELARARSLRNGARTPCFAGCTAQVPRVLRQNADRCLPDAGCAAVRDQGFPLLQRLPAQPVATGWQATAAGAALA